MKGEVKESTVQTVKAAQKHMVTEPGGLQIWRGWGCIPGQAGSLSHCCLIFTMRTPSSYPQGDRGRQTTYVKCLS